MRVLSVAFSAMPVGTALGGGAEQILSVIETGLVARGHESFVVACKGSKVAGELIESPGHTASPKGHFEAIEAALNRYPIDLVQFHGLEFHDYLPDATTPLLATLHMPISMYPAPVFERRPNLTLNCVSRSQAESDPATRSLAVIPNGIPTDRYAPAEPEDYLLWIGRVCPEKGTHIALEAARRLDARMIVAGPVHDFPEHQKYFAQRVQPLLDGKRVYVGPAEQDEKSRLLSRARCLLIPSLVSETSSLVAMESLASGTPVIASRVGALPEVVDDGETGFIVDSGDEMIERIPQIDEISRAHCRDQAIVRFDATGMIDAYLELYRRMLDSRRRAASNAAATACGPVPPAI